MKLNDVYRFSYSPEARETMFETYHCFDGQLIVRARDDGSLFLHDTFWGGSGGRTFTPEEARAKGELTFVCNLDGVEEIKDYEAPYYAEGDVFNLTSHHGHSKRWVRRRGALRSRDAILTHLHERLDKARRDVDSAVRSVEWVAREIQRVESATDLEALCI
mgnify:CR=1 FL=1